MREQLTGPHGHSPPPLSAGFLLPVLALLACIAAVATAQAQSFPGQFPSHTVFCNSRAATARGQTCAYPIIAVTDAPYFADATGTVDATTAIQAAINGLPVAGGIVFFPTGTYKVSSTLSLGNGTSSTGSTRYGIMLRGQCAAISAYFPGFPSTSCSKLSWAGGASDFIAVKGPLQGWGLENLFIECNGAGASANANVGLHVTSAQNGDSANFVLNNCVHGLQSDTVAPFGSFTNTNTQRNSYRNVQVQVPDIVNSIGVLLTGQVGANTTADVFINLDCSVPSESAGTEYCIDLQATDSVAFYNTKVFINGVAAGGVVFDYSVFSGWPAGVAFYGLDNAGPLGTQTFNQGTPGVGATPNYIYGLSETNGFIPPNIANLAVFSSHNINLNQGGNNPNTRLAATGGHLGYLGTAPTLTAGCNGAGSQVVGGSTDNAGQVEGQTANATTCTLTFAKAYTGTPYCIVTGNSAPLTSTVAVSTTTIIVNFSSAANFFWTYLCFGN